METGPQFIETASFFERKKMRSIYINALVDNDTGEGKTVSEWLRYHILL